MVFSGAAICIHDVLIGIVAIQSHALEMDATIGMATLSY